ncbi:DUF7006 family protein [Enterococcus mundtii]
MENGEVKEYLTQQFEKLNQLTSTISPDNFWEDFPKILGIDAKLTLIMELFQFQELSTKEILRIVETDYRTYFKEFCRNELNAKNNYSLVFNVV